MIKKYNKKSDFSYSIGVFPTIELLRNKGDTVAKVYINPKGDRNKGINEIVELCRKLRIQIEEDKKTIEIISRNENTYAIGVFRKYESTVDRNKNHLMLVEPSDMGNLGTICRTLLAFGFKDLAIIKPAVDIFDPKVVRSSMGAVFSIDFQYFSSFNEYRKNFSHTPYPFMVDGDSYISNISFSEPYTLVFGNEGSGLSNDYKGVGKSVKIEQSDDVDSLNLSIAVGISLYQASLKTN